MNYYDEIKERLIKSEIYDRAKDYSKDKHKVKAYYEIGRLLNEAGKDYGKNIIKQYAEKLIVGVGKNIMKELFIGYENSLKYLVMKNWTHWVQNWVGVIIEN